jgi:medium-chain acyl-[acyl-carrier-protein] hydrolase
MGARDWFVPLAEGPGPRLFAFPHAGAGTARLAGFARAVAPEVSVWAANLPGRQARLEEAPPTDLDALVEELSDPLVELVNGPYAIFGYCGGALLALLVARALRDRGVPDPTALVVVSFEAPDIGWRPTGLDRLPSDRLWSQLVEDGGVAADLIQDDNLRLVAEPSVRADFALLANYRHVDAAPLRCPITVCFGTEDATARGAWLGWRRQSTHPLRMHAVPGGHWLLEESTAELADAVLDAVRSPTAP